MKLLAGIALSLVVLAGAEAPVRPEIMFKPGTVMNFVGENDPKGYYHYKFTSTMEIMEAKVNGPHAISTAKITYKLDGEGAPEIYLVQFACDSLNYYVHALNWSYFNAANKKNLPQVSRGDSLCYPLNMKVGDTLLPASFHTVKDVEGAHIVSDCRFSGRKVVALDTIKDAFGTVTAFRIEMMKDDFSKATSSYANLYETSAKTEVVEWFSPQLGVVRSFYGTDYYAQRTKLKSYSVK